VWNVSSRSLLNIQKILAQGKAHPPGRRLQHTCGTWPRDGRCDRVKLLMVSGETNVETRPQENQSSASAVSTAVSQAVRRRHLKKGKEVAYWLHRPPLQPAWDRRPSAKPWSNGPPRTQAPSALCPSALRIHACRSTAGDTSIDATLHSQDMGSQGMSAGCGLNTTMASRSCPRAIVEERPQCYKVVSHLWPGNAPAPMPRATPSPPNLDFEPEATTPRETKDAARARVQSRARCRNPRH
jgi:hypothetical protein